MLNIAIYAMVKLFSRELTPMKLSSLKSICLAVSFWIIPSAPVLAEGYWQQGRWCSQENNYCRETLGNRYNGGWGNQNYYQPLESIEYNGVIIVHQQVPPRTDVCPWVVNRGLPCDGYIGFNESTRTHIFRNQFNGQYYRNGVYPATIWHRRRGGCVYQDKNTRVLCN